MGFNYTSLQKKIHNQIVKFGSQGTMTLTSSTSLDSDRPWGGNETGSSVTLIGMTLPLSREDISKYNLNEVERRYSKILISPLNPNEVALPEPIPSAKVTLNGRTWTLITSKPVDPAGTPLIYECVGAL